MLFLDRILEIHLAVRIAQCKLYCKQTLSIVKAMFLPPENEVWGKVIFLHPFVILFTGGVPGLGECLVPGGCLIPGGGLVQGGSGPGGVPGDPPGRLLMRAVRILLECILVCFDLCTTWYE